MYNLLHLVHFIYVMTFAGIVSFFKSVSATQKLPDIEVFISHLMVTLTLTTFVSIIETLEYFP